MIDNRVGILKNNMIVGTGDVASAIVDREDLLFFASGVSNSKEDRESEYQREKDLLMAQDHSKRIVYFSSLCIFYSESRYALHKRWMEALVQREFLNWNIVRLGNITWGKNPNTLINNLKQKIRQHESFDIQDTYRYIVSLKEFQHWMTLIPDFNCEMNITGRMLKVKDVLMHYVYE
jgi:hypothetical protein